VADGGRESVETLTAERSAHDHEHVDIASVIAKPAEDGRSVEIRGDQVVSEHASQHP
jgi:hypothetical protein